MDYDYIHKVVSKRRSIRRFRPDPIPDQYIEKIVELARWAMSGANAQPCEFIAVRSPDLRRQLCSIYCEWMRTVDAFEKTRVPELRLELNAESIFRDGSPFRDAPVIMAVLGDPRTLQATVQAGNILNPDNRTFNANYAIATYLLHLAAASLGLGSQWVSIVGGYESTVKAVLGVPEIYRLSVLVPIGYPAYEPAAPHRRKARDILHYDKYDMSKYRSANEVISFVASLRRTRRGPEVERERS